MTGCVKATFVKATKTLRLEKNCPMATNAFAGAEITGLSGQTFQSASFPLASATQCQGCSPGSMSIPRRVSSSSAATRDAHDECRRNLTYTFTAATLAAAASRFRRRPEQSVRNLLIDVQAADLTKVMVNGKLQKLAPADRLRPPVQEGRLEELLEPCFKNQVQCVKYLVHDRNTANEAT